MTQTELDRLIAMLEPQAGPDAVEFVRCEIGRLLHGAIPGAIDAEVNAENIRQAPAKDSRSEQQKHDVYEVKDWNPNDPANW